MMSSWCLSGRHRAKAVLPGELRYGRQQMGNQDEDLSPSRKLYQSRDASQYAARSSLSAKSAIRHRQGQKRNHRALNYHVIARSSRRIRF
jgi:hypothetical protein